MAAARPFHRNLELLALVSESRLKEVKVRAYGFMHKAVTALSDPRWSDADVGLKTSLFLDSIGWEVRGWILRTLREDSKTGVLLPLLHRRHQRYFWHILWFDFFYRGYDLTKCTSQTGNMDQDIIREMLTKKVCYLAKRQGATDLKARETMTIWNILRATPGFPQRILISVIGKAAYGRRVEDELAEHLASLPHLHKQ